MPALPLAQLLKIPLSAPIPTIAQNPSTSRKTWARVFQLNGWKRRSSTYAEFAMRFEVIDAEDSVRLQDQMQLRSHTTYIITEADVTSHLDENVLFLLKSAFGTYPYLYFLVQNFVDWPIKYNPPGKSASQCVTIGECKKPGVIKEREWRMQESVSSSTFDLGRELQGFDKPLFKCRYEANLRL